MSLELFDLTPIPLFNLDVEAEGDPEPVARFKERIAAADALLIATPEYNASVSGVLKNAIDWASRPPRQSVLSGKPAAIIGASQGALGTARAQMHLRQTAAFTNLLVLSRPELLVMKAQDLFDAELRLTDEGTRKRLRTLLEALAAWTLRLRGGSEESRA